MEEQKFYFEYYDIPPLPKQSARFAVADVPQPAGAKGPLPSRISASDYQRMIKGGGAPQSNGKVVSYRDTKVEMFHNAIALLSRRQLPSDFVPFNGRLIFLDIAFMFEVPKGRDYKQTRQALDAACKVYKITKPDNDNLVKAYLDALEGILYTNDAAVAKQNIEKLWSNRNGILATFTVFT